MSVNYAKQLPIDRNGAVMDHFPAPFTALSATHRENASASSVTSLNDNTTTLEVTAVTTAAVIKWGSGQATSVISAAAGANFDHVIPAGEMRRFVVPRNTQASPNYNNQGSPSITGLNTSEGLYPDVATKSTGVGSVLLTQY